jgi:lipid-binding SYLF domain-containing protein
VNIRMLVIHLGAALACALSPALAGAQQGQMSPAEYRKLLAKETQDTIARYRKIEPAIERFFKDSAGYAVYPRIGRMGFIIVGGQGEGELFEKGRVTGTASVVIATIGLSAGIQDFSQIIFFQDQAALDRFKQNKFEFTANASAVILATGAAKTANYREGVAVFAHPNSGAMAELSVGTQKFSYKPEGAPARN